MTINYGAMMPKSFFRMFSLSPGNPFILGQKSRSQCLCQCSDRPQYCCCCILKLQWVFPAV